MPVGSEILTTAQMRATESAAMSSGRVTAAELMERASRRRRPYPAALAPTGPGGGAVRAGIAARQQGPVRG